MPRLGRSQSRSAAVAVTAQIGSLNSAPEPQAKAHHAQIEQVTREKPEVAADDAARL